jgi:retron-type reverse transcriptase
MENRATDPEAACEEGREGSDHGTVSGKPRGTQRPLTVSTQQQRRAALATQRPAVRCPSVKHSLDVDWVREASRRVRKESAPGYDRQPGAEYGKALAAHRASLLQRAKSGTSVAPPVRRVHSPKGTGKTTRPSGMPTTEDQLLQRAVAMLLEPLDAQDFLDGS